MNLEKLKDEKDSAWNVYDKLRGPADAAYKKYELATAAYKEAVLHEKIRKKVIRELLSAAAMPTHPEK